MKNTRPRDTSANRARRDKNRKMMRTGPRNGAWKGGRSPHYYRRKARAKPGEVVHHRNHKKSDNRKKNLVVLKSVGSHNKRHPEKGRKAAKARKMKGN